MKKAIVVGCGLSGSVAARMLAEKGYDVTIWERRDHIAGNMYDYYDEYGIPVHKYGPHVFHTNSEQIFDFIRKFGQWVNFKIKCGAVIDDFCSPSPFNFTTVDHFYPPEKSDLLKLKLIKEFPGRSTVTVLEVMNSEDPDIREYGNFLFEKDYSLYTAKQWGLEPNTIDPSVLKRVPIRLDYEEGYFDDKYQAMPKTLYVDWFKELLNHPNIIVKRGVEALDRIKVKNNKIYVDGCEYKGLLIYTGAIDELFEYEFGKLPYRSLKLDFKHSSKSKFQPYPLVALPAHPQITRIVDFTQMYPHRSFNGSSYEEEYSLPYSKDAHNEPYYPIPMESSLRTYSKYRQKADQITNLILCGRLADYKYYNMDQCIKQTLDIVSSLLK